MKKAALIYDRAGAERNRWFIDELTKEARTFGVELVLCISAGDVCNLPQGAEGAVVRTISPALSQQLERRGMTVINNADVSRIANDKWKTYLYCKDLGLPVMETFLIGADGTGAEEFSYPLVLKSLDGHGGTEVFLVNSFAEVKEKLSVLKDKGSNFILQKVCSEAGKDCRVYMLGQDVLAGVLRTAQSGFKSNFSLGGNAERYAPTAAQAEAAKLICKNLSSDFVGVDFISDGGKWVVNEVEDCVGSRMLYKTYGMNVARIFAKRIADRFL